MRGNRDELCIATPIFRNHFFCRQLGLHALGVSRFLVDFVDCHQDRHIRRTRMLDRLFGLRHHTVICGDHQNDNISRLRPPRPHRGKRGVAGCVEEGDHPLVGFHVIGANVLGNTPRLTTGHTGFTDIVQQ